MNKQDQLDLHNAGIRKGLKDNLAHTDIIRKVYLSFPTFAFNNEYEKEYSIIDAISLKFGVSFSSIRVAGSAKTGHSYYKNTFFVKGDSDLDIAIVDRDLFLEYTGIVYDATRGFADLTKFPRNNETRNSLFNDYTYYILRGIFRPDLMPKCEAKNEWFNFFQKLSEEHKDLFESINAGIYLDEYYFAEKQLDNIDFFKRTYL